MSTNNRAVTICSYYTHICQDLFRTHKLINLKHKYSKFRSRSITFLQNVRLKHSLRFFWLTSPVTHASSEVWWKNLEARGGFPSAQCDNNKWSKMPPSLSEWDSCPYLNKSSALHKMQGACVMAHVWFLLPLRSIFQA